MVATHEPVTEPWISCTDLIRRTRAALHLTSDNRTQAGKLQRLRPGKAAIVANHTSPRRSPETAAVARYAPTRWSGSRCSQSRQPVREIARRHNFSHWTVPSEEGGRLPGLTAREVAQDTVLETRPCPRFREYGPAKDAPCLPPLVPDRFAEVDLLRGGAGARDRAGSAADNRPRPDFAVKVSPPQPEGPASDKP